MQDILNSLYDLIKDRKVNPTTESYTSSLFDAGIPRIAQKIGEEGVETTIAAVLQDKGQVAYEMADLWYHCLVLLVALDMNVSDIENELIKRQK